MNGKENFKQKKKFYYSLILFAGIILLIVMNFQKFLGVLSWIWAVFKPLVIGGCIAFVVNVLVDWLEKVVFTKNRIKKKGLRNTLCLITAIILVVLLFIAILWIAIPQLITSFRLLAERIPRALHTFTHFLRTMTDQYPFLETIATDIDSNSSDLTSDAMNYFKNVLPQTITQTVRIASSTVGAVATLIIGLMFSLYLLGYKDKFQKQCRQLAYSYLPEKRANQLLYIAHLTSDNFRAFIGGQCIEAVILAIMYSALALLFRLPYTFMIATVFAVFSLIPLFGAYIGWGIGAFLIITVNPWQAITFTIIFILVSQIEGNFIYPRIIGSSIGLPGIWVLAAVTVGGNMFGIAGMIAAVPIVALFYTLISENSQKRLRSHPDKVEEIIHKPSWHNYNPETDQFEDKPVHLENVFDKVGEDVDDIPFEELEQKKKKKHKFF